jgi:Stage II sporulation protein
MSLRDDALVLIATVVPSDYGDPRFSLLIGDMYREGPGAGTTCGFLPSFILLMIGCISPVIINRNAFEYGLYYHIGENISCLVSGARQLGAWVDGDQGIRAGDVFFLSNGPPLTEHVGHLVRDEGAAWLTADSGQRNASMHQAARYVRRTKAPGVLWTPNGSKTIQGYIDIDRLPYDGPNRAPRSATGIPTQIVTESEGVLDIEDNYIPRVVTREDGAAPPAALEAQVIASRTYLLRAMFDDRSLGTSAKPVRNSGRFQTYAPTATKQCIEATRATAGIVATYRHELILANYVAGALRTADGGIGADPTNTEQYVTYNEGKTGTSVKPTIQASVKRWQNRGSMGQNCANWLARHGYDHAKILRYFYGLDLELTDLRGAVPSPSPGRPTPRTPKPGPHDDDAEDGGALLAIAGAGLAWAFLRKS